MFRRIPPPPPDNRPPRQTQQPQYVGVADAEAEDQPIYQSVTAEEDDYAPPAAPVVQSRHDKYDVPAATMSPHQALVEQVRNSNNNNTPNNNNNKRRQHKQAVAYLLRYETMVRQQEAEDMATMAHLRPCFERILQLLGHDDYAGKDDDDTRTTVHSHDGGAWPSMDPNEYYDDEDEDASFWKQEVSFCDLKKALHIIESSSSTTQQSTPEFMTTDRQLLMVLRLLAQKAVHDTPSDCEGSSTSCSSNSQEEEDEEEEARNSITWAEVMQCYKVCIAGMHVLQHLPNNMVSSSMVTERNRNGNHSHHPAHGVVPVTDIIRTRARDRTLTMLSLFEPPSTRLFTDEIDGSSLVKKKRSGGARSSLANPSPRGGASADTWSSVKDSTMALLEETASNCMKKWKQSDKKQRGIMVVVLLALVISSLWMRPVMIENNAKPQHHPPRGSRRKTSTNTQHHPHTMRSPVIYKPPVLASSSKKKRTRAASRANLYNTPHGHFSPPPYFTHDQQGSTSTGSSLTAPLDADASAHHCTSNAPSTTSSSSSLNAQQQSFAGAAGAGVTVVDPMLMQPAIVGAVLGAPVIVAMVQLALSGLATGSLISTIVCGAGVVSLLSVAFRAAKHGLSRIIMSQSQQKTTTTRGVSSSESK